MRTLACLLVLLSGALAMPSWQEEMAVRDSFRHLPPNMRFREMHRLGLIDRSPVAPETDSGGLRLIGKWGGGPSVKVTGRDSLVFLSRGSEVVAINFADTANPEVLSHIQVNGLVSRSVLVGDRLYVGSTGSDPKFIDAFDVAVPSDPVLLGSVQTQLNDIAVLDTLVYAIGDDSFKVYNFADPENPWLVGACRDSGYDISVANGYAYLGDRWGLYVVDARDPQNPHRVASWGTDIISVAARNTICCVTTGNPNQPRELNFSVLDVTVPGMPVPIGYLADAGGIDLYLVDSLVLLSGYTVGDHEFRILSIADSTSPVHMGEAPTPGEGNWGVWADRAAARAYVADRMRGLLVVDIADLTNPVPGPNLLAAGKALDVHVAGELAYVADDGFGMVILDVAHPDQPSELGSIDSTRDMVSRTVAVKDSFAFMGWAPNFPWLRTVSVADPSNPQMAGGVDVFRFPEDMVLRDTLLYVAEAVRFQVVNVARPREPELVGSCSGDGVAIVVQDSFAYTAAGATRITNIARPDSPYVVATITGHSATGLAVRDTFLYLPYAYDTLFVYSIANPAQPQLLSATPTSVWPWDVVIGESTAYVACSDGYGVDIFSLADPGRPVQVGRASAPHDIRRLHYANGLLYAAMWDAGVAIYETTQTGVAEPGKSPGARGAFVVRPNPVARWCLLEVPTASTCVVVARDVSGRVVEVPQVREERYVQVDMGNLPSGIYFLEVQSTQRREVVKVTRR